MDVNEGNQDGTGSGAGMGREEWKRGEYAQENPDGFGRDVENGGDFS